jgi:hypothetical protein
MQQLVNQLKREIDISRKRLPKELKRGIDINGKIGQSAEDRNRF